MIRPFTVLCFLLACGSGLYLYQSKHRVQMLDREIERTVHATEALRDQSRLLGAEWMLLNDPERLRTLADQFLALKTVTPTQFTTLADLDHRLPPVRSPDAPLEPVPEPAVMTPMIPPPVASKDTPAPANSAGPSATPAVAATVPAVQAPALLPKAPTAPAIPHPAPAPLVAERKPAPEKPRIATTQADPRPTPEPRPSTEARGAQLASVTPRPAPTPRFTAPISQAVAPMQGGSALGMASHGALPPPMPIAPQSLNLMRVTDH